MDISGLPKFTIRGELRPAGDSFLPGAPFTSADDLRDFINNNLDAKGLVFEFSSFGGSLNQGFEMRDIINACTMNTIGIGFTVCSAAVLPYLACKKRFVTENATIVIHPARIAPENLGTNPLTASDFSELAQSITIDDKKIMDAYCATVGEANRSKILAYFGQETDLGAKGAIKLGFAHGYWKKQPSQPLENSVVFGVSDFVEEKFTNLEIQNFLKDKSMATTATAAELKVIKDQQTGLQKTMNGLLRLVGLLKNDVVLSDASGVKIGTVVAEDDNIQGKPAVSYDEAGMPTANALPDGAYTDDKGRTVNIKGGLVESVSAGAPPSDMAKENEELKKKVADMEAAALANKTEKEALTNKVKELETANTATKTAVTEVQNQFNEFKKLIPGDPSKVINKKDGEEMDADTWKNLSPVQRMHHIRMENKTKLKAA